MTSTSASAATIVVLAGSLTLFAACSDDCCTEIDSYPIELGRAPLGGPLPGAASSDGALVTWAAPPGGGMSGAFHAIVATGAPVTVLAGAASGSLATTTTGLDVFGAMPGDVAGPLRAKFRAIDVLRLPLQPVGDGSVPPGALLGGDLLRGYSVAFRLGGPCPATSAFAGTGVPCSSMTWWPRLGADEGFLEDAGYAVLHFNLFGGGEVTADGDPDFLGLRGPLQLPPTRIVLRTCGVPHTFDPATFASRACCTADDARKQSSGVDLALLLDTGVGPLIVSQSAWQRIYDEASAQFAAAQDTGDATVQLPPQPTDRSPSLLVATWPAPIYARWSTIPRFALVDLEAGGDRDPGPCVELGRAHRTEYVSWQTVFHPEGNVCFQPCDADPQEMSEAQNSAAYLELAGAIPVAIVDDEEPYLQALRFDVRPEGPDVDGVIGAAALAHTRFEIDYLSSPSRVVFDCETDILPDAPRTTTPCFAGARCPRLPTGSDRHLCFGLPAHGLAPLCAPSGC